jgi:cyclophilin family peptidyl-prolyl cis-trans isomerase
VIGLINSLTICQTVIRTIVVIGILCVLTGCNENKPTVKDGAKLVTPTVRTDVKKGIQPEPDEQVAVIETADYGSIVIELYPNIAPQMVKRFKTLASEEFYNGTAIHRINAASGLIQGGDPLSKNDNPSDDGLGESSYPNVPGEFSDIPYDRGTVGAARRGASLEFAGRAAVSEEQARNTANCQFFITMKRTPQFNEDYTVFGKVIEGLTNVEIIMRAPVEPNSERPAEKIVVKTVTLQPRSKYVR